MISKFEDIHSYESRMKYKRHNRKHKEVIELKAILATLRRLVLPSIIITIIFSIPVWVLAIVLGVAYVILHLFLKDTEWGLDE